MSLQGLISGSECAVPSNPLSQVLKHTESDRSLQQDRISLPSSSRLHHLPSTSASVASERDIALARQFFEGNPQMQGPSAGPLSTLPYNPTADLMHRPAINGGFDFNEAWANEQQVKQRILGERMSQAQWAAEFPATSQQLVLAGPSVAASRGIEYAVTPYNSSPGVYRPAMQWGGLGVPQMYNMSTDQGKGKGKSRDDEFEAAFAQIADFTPANPLAKVEDDITRMQEALVNMAVHDTAREAQLEAQGNEEEYGTDFKKVWDHLQDSDLPPPKEDLAKWEAEFNQLMSAKRDELDHDYGSSMQDAWESGIGDFQESGPQDAAQKFDDEGLPILPPYAFEQENKYLDPSSSNRSSLSEAKALLEQGGPLSEIGLLLEAAIQKGELGEGGFEAWILLGETRNMDERENDGLRALAHGVHLAGAAGSSSGMLSLAISYTNESYDRASHTMLMRWLQARFPSHAIPQETIKSLANHSSWDTHECLTDAFLSLARAQHSQGVMDPDVQIGLGVLFYTNGEYDRAKDCFESAVSIRPKDYLLWNRLGSALSNGNKPEEALGAYREALQLRPSYTRAIYNVGVACLNIGAYKEAAEHFLSALELQGASSESSQSIWFTLRRAFLALNRPDLIELAKQTTDMQVFRKEGFDF